MPRPTGRPAAPASAVLALRPTADSTVSGVEHATAVERERQAVLGRVDALDALRQMPATPAAASRAWNSRRHRLRPEARQGPRGDVDHVDRVARGDEVVGEFAAHQAGAEDGHARAALHLPAQPLVVRQVVDAEHADDGTARETEPARPAADGQHQAAVPGGSGRSRDGPRGAVDRVTACRARISMPCSPASCCAVADASRGPSSARRHWRASASNRARLRLR